MLIVALKSNGYNVAQACLNCKVGIKKFKEWLREDVFFSDAAYEAEVEAYSPVHERVFIGALKGDKSMIKLLQSQVSKSADLGRSDNFETDFEQLPEEIQDAEIVSQIQIAIEKGIDISALEEEFPEEFAEAKKMMLNGPSEEE